MNWMLANSAVVAVLCLVVLAIGRLGKPAPAVMHGLWLLVLLKLVTPPLFEVPVDLSWWSPPAGEAASAAVPAAGIPRGAPLERGAVDSGRIATPLPIAAVEAPPSESVGTPPWALAWAIGSTLFLLLTGISALRADRRRRVFGPVSGTLRREIERLAARVGTTVPELREDPRAAAPYIWSLGRVCMVLPGATLRSCSAKGRAAVLAHELAHLRRGDHWIARVELVMAIVLWWHPLFWFARSRLRLWAELACDAIAVATVPDAALDYATVLVDAAARPDSTGPGLAVLASRPAARAAFERRLLMILNDKTPRRVSPIWCVPFATLALGLFAVPVAAQRERESEPVRIEVRINGQRVEDLSAAERNALLKVLLRQEEGAEPVERRARQEPQPKPEPKPKPKPKPRVEVRHEVEGMRSGRELRGLISLGLSEARREIRSDQDLRELGITDEVLELIDGIAEGKGIESSLDAVVRAAMKGAGKIVVKEIENDEDLAKLGIADGIGKLVTGFLQNERNQEMIGDLAHQALKSAIGEARREIRGDADLRKLGITKDVEDLVDGIVTGNGDFEGSLERLIEKAMQAAMREVEREIGGSDPAEVSEPKVERRQNTRSRRVIR